MPRITAPRPDEPIRLVDTQGGPRYRVTLDVAPKGSPRRQITKTYATLKEARDYVTVTRAEITEKRFTAPSRTTLRQLTEDWFTTKRDVREVTMRGYRNAIRPALDRYGNRPVQDITRRDVELLVDWTAKEGGDKGEGLSVRSIGYLLVTLRMVLNYGISTGVLQVNPAAAVKPPRRRTDDEKPKVLWTTEQMMVFRSASDTDSWGYGMRLLLCGLRRSEVCGLKWDQVDLDAGTVRVVASRVVVGKGRTAADTAKSSASVRTVPVEKMHPGTVAMLKAAKVQQAADKLAHGSTYSGEGYVVSDVLGRGVHPDALTARWRTICGAANVPVIGTHSVRHTLATVLHQAGEAPADVAALLGHEVTTHLAFYVTRTEKGAARAASAFHDLSAVAR